MRRPRVFWEGTQVWFRDSEPVGEVSRGLSPVWSLSIDCSLTQGLMGSLVAQSVKNPPAMWETWVRSLGWEDPLEEGRATHPSILAWRMSHGQRSLVGYSPWDRQESDMTK